MSFLLLHNVYIHITFPFESVKHSFTFSLFKFLQVKKASTRVSQKPYFNNERVRWLHKSFSICGLGKKLEWVGDTDHVFGFVREAKPLFGLKPPSFTALTPDPVVGRAFLNSEQHLLSNPVATLLLSTSLLILQ
ncbi:unnamed protein product [Orchesella dallaii]|uniref:Uncharacterized protein n=1 Tax=Orchesella dallaii TaxID=48710 RepID=A0ABP1QAK7_9HEXA